MSNRQEEYGHQKELVKWCRLHALKYPGVELILSIPNGGMLAGRNEFVEGRNGKRVSLAAIRGRRLKEMGLAAGASDLFIPVPRFVYHGLFLEMKSAKGDHKDEQIAFGNAMIEQGYAYDVAYGWEHGAEILVGYYTGIMPKTGKAFVTSKFTQRKRGVFADEYEAIPF